MTKCNDIRAGLDDWLDGLADSHLRAEIDAHLAECDSCADFFKHQRDLKRDLRALSDAANRMADTVEAGMPTSHPLHWWPLLRIAAAILIVAGVGLYLAKPWQRQAPVQIADNPAAIQRGGESAPAPDFHVTVPDNRIAVPIESTNPRIHIVWLYQEVLPPDEDAGDDAGHLPALPS